MKIAKLTKFRMTDAVLQQSCPSQIPGMRPREISYQGLMLFEAEWRIRVSKLTIIGSDNGLSPGRRHDIIWTNAGILIIRTSGTNTDIGEILNEIHTFSFKKMHLKMSSAKWRQFYLDLNVLIGGVVARRLSRNQSTRKCETLKQNAWAYFQIRKIAGCACTGNAGNIFPATG